MTNGLSGGIVVATPQMGKSRYVPEIELPALLRLENLFEAVSDQCRAFLQYLDPTAKE